MTDKAREQKQRRLGAIVSISIAIGLLAGVFLAVGDRSYRDSWDFMGKLLLLCIGAAIVFLPAIVAGRRRHRQQGAIGMMNFIALATLVPLFCFPALALLSPVFWLVALVWACTSDVKSPPPPVEEAGPGRYIVSGVDKQTGMDTVLAVDADSRSNAIVKAELKGMVVTQATRAHMQGGAHAE